MGSKFDPEIVAIVDYVYDTKIESSAAYHTAKHCFIDSIGCAFLALNYPACVSFLGPVIPNTVVPNGVPVLGTSYVLDPIQAAVQLGILIRWLDYNDTWLAAEWAHPSDNLGGILSVAYYISCQRILLNKPALTMHDIFTAMIKAHEIQGVLALENSFNRVGLDHVILVKFATVVVVSYLLGSSKEQALHALSLAVVDGHSLRTYRHAPNVGSRKSWAAGDATGRGVEFALMAAKGVLGCPSALSSPIWGFYDVLFKGEKFSMQRDYGSYVMENILFKISYPAEFHAQTAVECAIKLHHEVIDKLDDIASINIMTHESAIRIIDKTGKLNNPADRDHCLQYMVAIGLLFGELTANHYEDDTASDSRIDWLREKMIVTENDSYTKDYLDPAKRSIANSIQIIFKDGLATNVITSEYPIGHLRRRAEGLPLLIEKFKQNAGTVLGNDSAAAMLGLFMSDNFNEMSVVDMMHYISDTTHR